MVVYLPGLGFFSFMSLKAGFFVEGAICGFAILVLGMLCYRLWKELYLPRKAMGIFSGLLALAWAFTIFQADPMGSPLAYFYDAWCFGLPAVLVAIAAKFHNNALKAQQLPAGDGPKAAPEE